MARAVGVGCLHHFAGVRVDDDRCRRRLIGGSGGPDAGTVTATASVGITGEGGDRDEQRYTDRSPAETRTHFPISTQIGSPQPVFWAL
jgi:hypothetical protein